MSDEKLDQLISMVTDVQSNVKSLQTEMKGIKSDVRTVQSDMQAMKRDIDGMKTVQNQHSQAFKEISDRQIAQDYLMDILSSRSLKHEVKLRNVPYHFETETGAL